jgi:hypothetical protein
VSRRAQLRLGVHRSVAQLKTAIRDLIAAQLAKATPFVWTKSADEILASIARFAQRTLDFHTRYLLREPRGQDISEASPQTDE